MEISRRQFLKLGAVTSAGLAMPLRLGGVPSALAAQVFAQLSDAAAQPKFVNHAPNALHPLYKYQPAPNGEYTVGVGPTAQWTGLVNPDGKPLFTPVFGYGQDYDYNWPGKTFEVQRSSGGTTVVNWNNDLFRQRHILSVDTSLHWAYSLNGYERYSINKDGIPIVVHLHGGHTDYQFDGNPEFFYSPGGAIQGPQWDHVERGFTRRFVYDNDVPAGNLWYHDHALGITRLNVYAGMAGFYFVRDSADTGTADNPLGLPAFPYELAYAIQDRMFQKNGRLFYPAFPSDPYWEDFVREEGLNTGLVPKPSALAEFFGDHMVVNGLIWPEAGVEPRNYRMHLLNGTDSRFLVIRFRAAATPTATDLENAGAPIPFHVVGSDQGLASAATQTDTLLFEPGSRYDIVFDFEGLEGERIIMENIGGDAPFGGAFGDELGEEDVFPNRQTDRIMAFDVVLPLDGAVPDNFVPGAIGAYGGNTAPVDRVRKVALFEGKDEYGRLQPLLGTAEPATDHQGNPINWPDTPHYADAGLTGQMEGAIPWHSPTTENPALGDTEIWEIYNTTGDAHPVHLHLVNFQIGTGDEVTYGPARQEFTASVDEQPVVQHNGLLGNGFRLENIVLGAEVDAGPEYVENAPKDMVTALPGQVTRIKATFDKSGRYVWHCHILSHEDHEMMRVLHVGEGA